ncbi:GGDEF domain-containing protein [Parasalinivibrio latis]|uniref:tetratricopeptide repeat protein n=1 Tax=Parasalinivibrio latis TaxID=2952610 RepID=UPI0030E0DA18
MRHLKVILAAATLFLCSSARAELNTAPILSDALNLLETNPSQSLSITDNYLKERRLTQPSGSNHMNDEGDRQIRSPLHTIHAHIIKGMALVALGRIDEGLQSMQKADLMAQEYKLVSARLAALIAKASTHWKSYNDSLMALNLLAEFQQLVSDTKVVSTNLPELKFHAALLSAIIYSNTDHQEKALQAFHNAENLIKKLSDGERPKLQTIYLTALGKHFLQQQDYEGALAELLQSYWIASENQLESELARINVELSRLYLLRGVLDKAQQHANQAADFYEHFRLRDRLTEVLRLLANVYEIQGRYNFSLATYFNALDWADQNGQKALQAPLLVAVSRIYLELHHLGLAKEYVEDALKIAKENKDKPTLSEAYIQLGKVQADMLHYPDAIQSLHSGILLATEVGSTSLKRNGLAALSMVYEDSGDYFNALRTQRELESLSPAKAAQAKVAKAFKQQQQVIERQLQMDDMQRQLSDSVQAFMNQRNLSAILLIVLVILAATLYSRHRIAVLRKFKLQNLRDEFYTHPRSGLRNLRMLNARLQNSLQQSSANFEQWTLGEIIHEPFHDRLRFAMFEVPFLKIVYLEHGYKEGLKLEREFGNYLNDQVTDPARLYHFSDAMFIYIEPNSRLDSQPEQLAGSVQKLIDDFIEHHKERNLDNRARIGMAEYPFLSRASTAINDQELIDILLMATSAARLISKKEDGSQWVHLSAIEHAPAASFAGDNIRQACLDGIKTGLVKTKTSSKLDFEWHEDHDK